MFYNETDFKETSIGRIPNDWDVVEAVSVVDVLKGYAFGSEFFTEKREGMPLIRIRDLGKDETESYYSGEYDSDYIVTKEDILVSMDGEFNVYSWKGPEGLLNQRVCKVSSKDTTKVTNRFLYYALQKPIKILESQISQTTVKHLLDKDIERIKIPFPSLLEQKKIAEVLGVVDLAVEKTGEVIAKTERLKKGLMKELLTKGIGHKEHKQTPIGKIPKEWEVKTLEEVCTTIIDCPHTTPKFTDKGVLIVRNFNIREGELILEPAYYTTEEEWQTRTRRCIPENDDVLFSREAPIGEACLAPRNTRFSLGQRTMLLRPDKKFLNPLFLTYIFYSSLIRRRLRNLEAGVTAHHVNVADIRRLKIPLPNLNEQERIAFMISTVIEKLKLEKKENAKLERVKRGLVDLLLTGKVRIKVD